MPRSRSTAHPPRNDHAATVEVTALLIRTRALHAHLAAAGGQGSDENDALLTAAADRLARSAIRPLAAWLERPGATKAPTTPANEASRQSAADALWQLAIDATAARVSHDASSELLEATAALQALACQLASDEGSGNHDQRLAELRSIQANLESEIRASTNGPYLVTNADRIRDWLGDPIPTTPQMALCRCGASKTKPFCDGTHAEIGFTDAKDPDRVPDRRDTYVGQQATIYDNRGTCQHSGFCTDRLATVFRSKQDPFVAPSGGRMDEIIRAVRGCPSGALSYAIDGREAREQVDWDNTRKPTIEVSKDGPYRITGAIPLTDAHGRRAKRNQGASLEHYALCRCGHSQNKPFCSGMHYYVDFHDPVADPDHEPTLYEWCGGLPALTRMTRLFYEKYVPQDPLLAPLFANMSADHPERVAKWLGEVFGGPPRYTDQHGGYPRMLSQHIGKGLTEEKRARWVALISQSAQEAGLPADPEFRSAFTSYIEWGSRLALENSQPGATPPHSLQAPHWRWGNSGPPGIRVSALAPPEEPQAPVIVPAVNEPVGYGAHIKPLFRDRDRRSMQFAFDLWSHGDVSVHADAILERLEAGTMPCDGAWPNEHVAVFKRWVDTGKLG